VVAQVELRCCGLNDQLVVHVPDFGHDATMQRLVVMRVVMVACGEGGDGCQGEGGAGREGTKSNRHESSYRVTVVEIG